MFKKKKYLVIRSSKDIAKIKKIMKKNIAIRKKKKTKIPKWKTQVRVEYY